MAASSQPLCDPGMAPGDRGVGSRPTSVVYAALKWRGRQPFHDRTCRTSSPRRSVSIRPGPPRTRRSLICCGAREPMVMTSPAGSSIGPGAGRDRITYVDFTFSAPKSVSIAMALAPTQAERHMIVGAHRDAWMSAMEHLETIVAHARKGKGGLKGSVAGELGWVSFDHYTARPTIEIPHTEADGTRTTLIPDGAKPQSSGRHAAPHPCDDPQFSRMR